MRGGYDGRLGGSCRLLSGSILVTTALMVICYACDCYSGIGCWTGGVMIWLLATRNRRPQRRPRGQLKMTNGSWQSRHALKRMIRPPTGKDLREPFWKQGTCPNKTEFSLYVRNGLKTNRLKCPDLCAFGQDYCDMTSLLRSISTILRYFAHVAVIFSRIYCSSPNLY